jgi:hypothetical protein
MNRNAVRNRIIKCVSGEASDRNETCTGRKVILLTQWQRA